MTKPYSKTTDKDIVGPFSLPEVKVLLSRTDLNLNNEDFTAQDLQEGMNVELEHKALTDGDASDTMLIALDHLREKPNYYKLLKTVEQDATDARSLSLMGVDSADELEEEINNILKTKEAAVAKTLNSFEKIAEELTDIAKSLDDQGFHDQAASVDELTIRAFQEFEVIKTANMWTDLKSKIKTRFDGIELDDSTEAVKPKQLPKGLTVEILAAPSADMAVDEVPAVVISTMGQLDKLVREHKISIDKFVSAVLDKMVDNQLFDSVAELKAADFASKFDTAKAVAIKHGLISK